MCHATSINAQNDARPLLSITAAYPTIQIQNIMLKTLTDTHKFIENLTFPKNLLPKKREQDFRRAVKRFLSNSPYGCMCLFHRLRIVTNDETILSPDGHTHTHIYTLWVTDSERTLWQMEFVTVCKVGRHNSHFSTREYWLFLSPSSPSWLLFLLSWSYLNRLLIWLILSFQLFLNRYTFQTLHIYND